MRAKTEQEFQHEQERLWRQMQDEKDRERAAAAARLRDLEEERSRIEGALERERVERERIQHMEESHKQNTLLLQQQ